MLYVLLLSHLLGDYFFQWGFIARWKTRSPVGVLAHGAIVTLTTLACAALVDASWWPWALLIGLSHVAIDLVRARYARTPHPSLQLLWYLLDQAAHLGIIVLVVTWSGAPAVADVRGVAGLLLNRRVLAYVIGYLLLASPAWVLLRFTVRGVWGADAAPRLGEGAKYGPMLERALIATYVLLGQGHLAPLVLLPRRVVPVHVEGQGIGALWQSGEHWAETVLSSLLALAIGLALQLPGVC
jgi:hypothetical protein